MKSPGPTSFDRMFATALAEAERIEISQDAMVRDRLIDRPMASEAARRDDFAGMMRLIQAIESDAELIEKVKARMKAMRAAQATSQTGRENVLAAVDDDVNGDDEKGETS